jgi:pyruvate-formate lyase-activating enzyme
MNILFPTRSAYREAWDRASTEDPPTVLNVDIELSSMCNLACPFCAWGDHEGFVVEMRGKDWDGLPKRRFMSSLMAAGLIDECDSIGVPAIKLNLRGEPTLHPEFNQILQNAKTKSFHDILINTNGNGPASAIEGLLCATKVMVSLDSLDPATYEAMRPGGDLGRVCDLVHDLTQRGHTNVWVRRVITSQNKSEPFAERARRLFGNGVFVAEHFAFDRTPQALMLNRNDGGWPRRYCGYPSQRLIVTAAGLVLPCCVDWRCSMVLGIWPQQSLLDIWNGEMLKTLRETLKKNDADCMSRTCRTCTSFMAYDKPERDSVQDKEVAA